MTLITNLSSARGDGRWAGSSIASFERQTTTTPYSAGTVVGANGATILEFPDCDRSGKILEVLISMQIATTADFLLYVFDDIPTSQVDGGALALTATDLEKLISWYTFSSTTGKLVPTPGLATYCSAGGMIASTPRPYTSGGSLYGLLVAATTFTPVTGARIVVRLQLEIDRP